MNKFEKIIQEAINSGTTDIISLEYIKTFNTKIEFDCIFKWDDEEECFYDDIFWVCIEASKLCENGDNWRFDIDVNCDYGECTIHF